MEHRNPLLPETSAQKFITFGEIMLRLTPPNYEKIRVATSFEASYGGSEANVVSSRQNSGNTHSVSPDLPPSEVMKKSFSR